MDTSLNKSLCRAYPHAFAVPERKVDALLLLFCLSTDDDIEMGGSYNYMVRFIQVSWMFLSCSLCSHMLCSIKSSGVP